MKWFGTNFGPICDDAPEVPVPVHVRCAYCQEPIVAGDSGLVIPSWPGEVVEHRECFLRQVVGSVGHQMKCCTCYGTEDLSETGLTRRHAAQLATAYYRAMMLRAARGGSAEDDL